MDKANEKDLEAAEKPASKENVEAYNKIVQHAKLTDIKLTDGRFTLKPEYFLLAEEEESGAKKKALVRNFNCDVSPMEIDREHGILCGFFKWTVSVKKGRKRLVSVSATFVVAYSDVPDIPDDPAHAFLEKVGSIASYPYFRSFVSQLSWASGADLPILPILK